MNMEMVLGLVRHLLTFGGGFVVAKGWLDEGSVTEVVGAAITIIGSVWSVFQKKEAKVAE